MRKKGNELGSRVNSLGLEAQVVLPHDKHAHCNLVRIPGVLFYEGTRDPMVITSQVRSD